MPWNEIEATGFTIIAKLRDVVGSGRRPQLPPGSGPAPAGYAELMEHCWESGPEERPTFGEIDKRVTAMRSGPKRVGSRLGSTKL
jgi:hypothetical protein